MRMLWLLTLSAAGWTASLCGQTKPVPTSPGGKALKIAVLEMDPLLEGYKRYKELSRKVEEKFSPEGQRLKAREAKLKERAQTINFSPLRHDSAEYRKQVEDFKGDEASLRRAGQAFMKKMGAEKSRALNLIMDDVHAVIQVYAREQSLDLVFKRRIADPRNPAKSRFELELNAVVFHSKEVDITQDILKRLNDAYDRKEFPGDALHKGSGGDPVGPPAPATLPGLGPSGPPPPGPRPERE